MSVTFSQGSQQDLNWYLFTTIHPVGDGLGSDAESRYVEFRRILGTRAEVVYEPNVRVIPEYPASTILNVPSGSRTVYQILFGVHAYSDAWQRRTLIDQIDSTGTWSKDLPTDSRILIDLLSSIWNGHLIRYSNGTSWIQADVMLTDSIPAATDGRTNQFWLVEQQGKFEIWVKSLIWERLDQYLSRTGKSLLVQSSEPAVSSDIWINLDQGNYRSYNDVTKSFSSGLTYTSGTSLPGSGSTGDLFLLLDQNYQMSFWTYDSGWFPLNLFSSSYRGSGYGDLIYEDTYTIDVGESALYGGPISEGGMVEIYNNDCSPGNLVAATTKLVWAGSSDIAYVNSSCPDSVYIGPAPSYLSHWNSNDGTNGDQSVPDVSVITARVSEPTSEGVPFRTDGWANSNQNVRNNTTSSWTTPLNTTGFGGNSTFSVQVKSSSSGVSYGSAILNCTGNGTNTNQGITITLTNFGTDSFRSQGKITVSLDHSVLLSGNSGRCYVVMTHTPDTSTDGSGPFTKTQEYFYDANTPAVTVSGVSIAETTGQVSSKHLSGIEYYTIGSKFDVSVTGIDYLNSDTAKTSGNLTVTGTEYGLTTVSHSPFGTGSSNFSGYTNKFDNTGTSYTNSGVSVATASYRFCGSTANISAYSSDPYSNSSTVVSSNSPVLIDTYGTTSTSLIEYFDDEARRLTSTGSAWDSTVTLGVNDALVYGGKLLVPNRAFTLSPGAGAAGSLTNFASYKPDLNGSNPDYSGSTGTDYYRNFTFGAGDASAFSLVFSGTFVSGSALADLQNGNLQIFVYKLSGLGNTGYPPGNSSPLWAHAAYNFGTFDDGLTQSSAGAGCRTGTSSGNTIQMTFGGQNAQTGVFVNVKLINSGVQLDSMSASFTVI